MTKTIAQRITRYVSVFVLVAAGVLLLVAGVALRFTSRRSTWGEALWLLPWIAAGIAIVYLVMVVALRVGLRRIVPAEMAESLASTSEYRLLVDNLEDVVMTLARDGVIRQASPSARAVLGSPPEELVGSNIADFLDEEAGAQVLDWIASGTGAEAARFTLNAHRSDEEPIVVKITLAPLPGSDEVQAIVRDVTARKQHEIELLRMASHDLLTGLHNRKRFEEDLSRELARANRSQAHGAVLWFGLDGLKDVNRTLGHLAGDELLVAIARRLKATTRAESSLARLGGDEFAVVLPEADAPEATAAAERLLKEVSDVAVPVRGNVARATCCVGIALYPEQGGDVNEILSRADMAMSRAKRAGSSQHCIFDDGEEWRDEAESGRVWAEFVQIALAEDNLIAYAQPIIDVGTREVVAYELLVRIFGADGQLIGPDRFIPIAERWGLIVDIDTWMLGEAVRILEASGDADFLVNVNVSPRSLSDGRFLEVLKRILSVSAIAPRRLVIEITETAVIFDITKAGEAMRSIRGLGCRLSLDDFGSGFTSFLHLKQLPVDEIKIDGSFVRGLCESLSDEHLVRAMVEMARGLNMRTTAEFVETECILGMLASLGVDMAQGYVIDRPRPADEVMEARRLR